MSGVDDSAGSDGLTKPNADRKVNSNSSMLKVSLEVKAHTLN